MCNICYYIRRTHWDQFACFKCKRVKNIRRQKISQFETSYGFNKAKETIGICSCCAQPMKYVGPTFKAPKQRNIKRGQFSPTNS